MKRLYYLLFAVLAIMGTSTAVAQNDYVQRLKGYGFILDGRNQTGQPDKLVDGQDYLIYWGGMECLAVDERASNATTEIIKSAPIPGRPHGAFNSAFCVNVKQCAGDSAVITLKTYGGMGKYVGKLGSSLQTAETPGVYTVKGVGRKRFMNGDLFCYIKQGSKYVSVEGDKLFLTDSINASAWSFVPGRGFDTTNIHDVTEQLYYEDELIASERLWILGVSGYWNWPRPFGENYSYFDIRGYEEYDGTDTLKLKLVVNPDIKLPFAITPKSYYDNGGYYYDKEKASWYGIQAQSQGNVWLRLNKDTKDTLFVQREPWTAEDFYSDYKSLTNSIQYFVTGDPYTGFDFHTKEGSYVKNLHLYHRYTGDGPQWLLMEYRRGRVLSVRGDAVNPKLELVTADADKGAIDGTPFAFISEGDFPQLKAENVPAVKNGNLNIVHEFDFEGARADKSLQGEALFNKYQTHIAPNRLYRIYTEDAKYPAIRFLGTGNTLTDTEGKSLEGQEQALMREKEGPVSPQLWRFEKNDKGAYTIRNANTNCAIGKWKGDHRNISMLTTTQDERNNAGQYAPIYVHLKKAPICALTDKSNLDYNAFTTSNDKYSPYVIGGYYYSDTTSWSRKEDFGIWYIEQVNTVPLTINARTQWASVTYPFGAELPEELTAFIATGADAQSSVVKLKGIGREIPAHTPVFVTLKEGKLMDTQTFNVSINDSIEGNDDLLQENLLRPTTAARSGFAPRSLYVLTSNAEGDGPELKRNGNVVTIPANKAYLPISALGNSFSGVRSLHFTADETTGIGSIGAPDDDADAYYDLSGRRVLYPSHGIFINAKGQKVYIR